MEREKELVKLINVLRRTSRMALQAEWTGSKEDAAAFCTDQYNRVLTRLTLPGALYLAIVHFSLIAAPAQFS